MAEQDKIYCKFCRHCVYDSGIQDYCCDNDYSIVKYTATFYEPEHEKRCKNTCTRCSVKNKAWDCKDFEIKKVWR